MSPFPILLILLFSTCLSQNIILPKRLTVPRDDCRRFPILYSNISSPTSLAFQINPTTYFEIFPAILTLDYSDTIEHSDSILICTSNSTKPDNFTIQYNLVDQTGNVIGESTNKIDISIDQKTNASQINKVEWKNQKVKGTCVDVTVNTPGGNGTLYYTMNDQWGRLEDCKEFQSTCRNASVKNMQGGRYWFEIGRKQVVGNDTQIVLKNLIEARNYNLCVFYRDNKKSENSPISCRQFITDSSGNMQRGRFQFTSQIDDPTKINTFLCFVTNYLGGSPHDVVTIDGLYCNASGTEPKGYYDSFQVNAYDGITIRSGNETIVYVSQGCSESESKSLQQKFNQIWDKNGKISPNFNKLLQDSNITWIKSGSNLGSKSIEQMLSPTNSLNIKYTPTITPYTQPQTNASYLSYNISNLTSQNHGTAYFILLSNSSQPITLTPQQVISCTFNGTYVGLCQRVTFSGSEPAFAGYRSPKSLEETSRVYYVEASEYPRQAVPLGEVREVKFVATGGDIVNVQKMKGAS